MGVLANPKARKVIEERASQGLCIIEGCKNHFVSRGLCRRHANQFFSEQRNLADDDQRLEHENEMIRKGFVLPIRQQAKYRDTDNPFKQRAAQ